MVQFVEVYVDPEKDQILTDNQVMYIRKNSSPYIEVEQGDLHRALSLLGGEQTIYSKSLVVIDGHISTVDSPHNLGRSLITTIGKLAVEKQAVIRLRKIQGFTAIVRSKGEYYISILSLPDEEAWTRENNVIDLVPRTNFVFDGIELQPRGSATSFQGYSSSLIRGMLEESGLEYGVMEDDNGDIFALYTPFNAWVVIDLTNGQETLLPIFHKLLENMNALVENLELFMEEQEKEERQEILLRWGTLVAGRHDESVKECQEMLKEANDKVVHLRVEMTEALSGIPEIERVLRIAAEVRPDEEALAVEFSRIYENPWIDKIEIDESGEWMTVFTHTLVMDGDEDIRTNNEDTQERWANLLVPIGKFSIRVGSSGRVKIENLTGSKERDGHKWYHPHIPASGDPCFGTIETALPKMLAKYEFGAAIHLLTGFLTCCNADDAWGMQIYMWEDDAYPKPPSISNVASVEAEAVAS